MNKDNEMDSYKLGKINQWKTAIGLQAVDGLQPSNYLYELAGKHIEGELTINEVQSFLESYYENKENHSTTANTNEADKVSANIMEILEDNRFCLCPDEFRNIHESLFHNVFPHAGTYRLHNLLKREWVLQRDSVEYGDYHTIIPELERLMDDEANFNYSRLTKEQEIEHFAEFMAKIWKVHPFLEGNTRTTAIFAIKYARSKGHDINNEVFRNHSLYFRNALVRANYSNERLGIARNPLFLHHFFDNLFNKANHVLKNRDMLILPPENWTRTEEKKIDVAKKKTPSLLKKVTGIEIYKHNGNINSIKCFIDNVEQKGKHVKIEDLMKWYKIKDKAPNQAKEEFLKELACRYFEKEISHTLIEERTQGKGIKR